MASTEKKTSEETTAELIRILNKVHKNETHPVNVIRGIEDMYKSLYSTPAVSLDGLREKFENKFGKAERLNPIFNFFALYLAPLSSIEREPDGFIVDGKITRNQVGLIPPKSAKAFCFIPIPTEKKVVEVKKCQHKGIHNSPCVYLNSQHMPPIPGNKMVEDWEYLARTFHRKYRTNIQMTENFFVERLVSAIKEHTLPISDNKEGEELSNNDSVQYNVVFENNVVSVKKTELHSSNNLLPTTDKKPLIIDAIDEINDFAVLIVNYPTGVHYTAQCGGIGCTHPTLEGFRIDLWTMEFDDCSFGCHHLNNEGAEILREHLANSLDAYLKKATERCIIKLSFDFGNIGCLQEGWWPVIIKGRVGNIENFEGTGIIHAGNCD